MSAEFSEKLRENFGWRGGGAPLDPPLHILGTCPKLIQYNNSIKLLPERLGSVQVSIRIYVSLQCMFNYSTAQGVIVYIYNFKRVIG